MVEFKIQQENSRLLRGARNGMGFSLVEILVSTIVMTMMMVSVIAYIQYGSEIWQRGHAKISAKNYTRMAFDLIKQDLLKATNVSVPVASTSITASSSLNYSMLVQNVPATFSLRIHVPAEMTLHKKIVASTTLTWDARLARHVNFFQVSRISTWTFKIDLQINGDPDTEGNIEIVSSESIVLIAPGAGG